MPWRSIAVMLPLLVLLGAAGWLAYSEWISIPGPPMPTGGYIAMGLGIAFSFVIGCGLMALVFISSRRGYDDEAHNEHRGERDGL